MSTLIVAGLLAFGLLAIIAAILLAMNESKTSPISSTPSSIPEISPAASMPPAATPAPEQRLPAIREEAQVSGITTQFSELTAQLRALHEQAREIEQRLSVLSTIAEKIEQHQSRVSIEETENYRLLEPGNIIPVSS